MRFLSLIALILVFYSVFMPLVASARLCDQIKAIPCPDSFGGSRSSSGGSLPSNTSSMNFNPAALSVDRGFGVETIQYRGNYDFSIVTGTGAIGSGLSSTNNEGTYFGNVANQSIENYKQRKLGNKKVTNTKYSLAVAFALTGKSGKKKRKRWSWTPELTLGTLAKYNTDTKKTAGGGGLTVNWGPFMGSISRYSDDYLDEISKTRIKYYVTTKQAGFRIANIVAEYTAVESATPEPSSVDIITGTIFFNDVMFTYGTRKEYSIFPKFLHERDQFEDAWIKEDKFLGIQLIIKKKVLIGTFYNYYLNRDLSIGLTAFY